MTYIFLSILLIIFGLLQFQNGSNSAAGICTDGDVKLKDGKTEYEGRLELCYKGEWGAVCHEGSNNRVAKVVCSQLGLPLHDPKVVLHYPGGKGPFHIRDVVCNGNEDNLLKCTHIKIEEETNEYCVPPYDVGISCAPPCSEGEVRLLIDRVQTCHNEVWGYVCTEHGWSRNEAAVVCRELGFPPEDALSDHESLYHDHYFPYLLNATNCNGSEEHLIDCPQSSEGSRCGDFYEVAVAYCSGNSPCNETGVLRTSQLGKNTDYLGRLEICYNGYWGSVCDDSTNDFTAAVACRELGYYDVVRGRIRALGEFDVALPNIPIVLDNVKCGGDETFLVNCTHNGFNEHNCVHYEDIVLECSVRECNNTDVHLIDGQTMFDGQVEICLNGLWVSVCDNKWDNRDAEVVCRQLGYNGISYALREYNGNRNVISGSTLSCAGNETRLFDCLVLEDNIPFCSSGTAKSLVMCTDTSCEEDAVRLVGGHTVKEGRVQLCYNGEWHSVCGDRWSEMGAEADVVCSVLGFSFESVSVKASFGWDSSPIWPEHIQCNGNEASFRNCTVHNLIECHQLAGVICEAPCLFNGTTECSECSSETGCPPIPSTLCYCTSDCYSNGACCPDVGYLQNCLVSVEDCETGDIHLVGGVANPSSGLLEVCMNGVWGTVCDYLNEWNHENAAVVCRQLNLPTSSAIMIPSSMFDSTPHGPVLLDKVHCTGDEELLMDCSHSSIGNHFCSQFLQDGSSRVAIQCAADCEEGGVRLQDGTDPSNGRVEVCRNGIWGSPCSSHWNISDARVLCKQLGFESEGVEVTDVFGPGGSVRVSDIQCNGTEENIRLCPTSGNYACESGVSAGVICSRSFDIAKKCIDEDNTQPPDQRKIINIERFGICEHYAGGIEMCNDIFTTGVDYVFISSSHGSQNYTSMILDQNIPPHFDVISGTDARFCYDQLRKLICNYFLSPCRAISSQLAPHSICAEDCSAVQRDCPNGWQAAQQGFEKYQFINCSDTSALLFPLPSCCTGVGLKDAQGTEKSVIGGTVGSVVFCVSASIITIVIAYSFLKWRTKKRSRNFQMDIFAKPERSATEVMEISSKFDADLNTNLYTGSRPHISTNVLRVDASSKRARLNSHHLRELTIGKFLIKYEQITQLENIGQGEFGVVYRARLGPMGLSGREVAVKTLKGYFDQLEVNKFVEESLKMSRFKHTHVMGLIGVCLDAGSAPYIVMPYMANGSLLQYLKKERNNLVFPEDTEESEVQDVRKRLLVMCLQIASGMEYLASEKYVHRDLAARNCMIDSHFLIKITDFGLSEDVFLRNYYREQAAGEMTKLPVKWMAPESLSDGHFSEKSDVWSYGVTVWEIFSGGKTPYPATNPLTLLRMLEEGERMPKPYNAACSEEIYMMMMKCWEMMAEDRPSFKELHKKTSKYIERIAGYLEMGFNPFTGMGFTMAEEVQSSVDKMNKVEEEQEMAPPVVTQDTPRSGEISAENNIFTNTAD